MVKMQWEDHFPQVADQLVAFSMFAHVIFFDGHHESLKLRLYKIQPSFANFTFKLIIGPYIDFCNLSITT